MEKVIGESVKKTNQVKILAINDSHVDESVDVVAEVLETVELFEEEVADDAQESTFVLKTACEDSEYSSDNDDSDLASSEEWY